MITERLRLLNSKQMLKARFRDRREKEFGVGGEEGQI